VLPINLIRIPLKALIKMGNTFYPLSSLGYYIHLGIFAPSVQSLDLELIEISIFSENHIINILSSKVGAHFRQTPYMGICTLLRY
jgi:hypothetical protein